MLDVIQKFYRLLTPRERRNLGLLFVAMVIMAGLEVVAVAAILPFLSVAADPSVVQENAYLLWAYETLGFGSTNRFLVALGIGAFVALIVSNAFISFTTWAKYRYVFRRNHTLSVRLLSRYLRQPYEFFLNRNSADLSKNILGEVYEVTRELLEPLLLALAKGVVTLAIVGFLIYLDPVLALVVALVLGSAYGGIYLGIRRYLDRIGRERVVANRERYTAAGEAFGGIKEVKLSGTEESFLHRYRPASLKYSDHHSNSKAIAMIPRYVLEAIAFGGIILITVYLLGTAGEVQQIIPMLGVYALAGYRLMPALQQVFKGVAKARFTKAALNTVYTDLFEDQPAQQHKPRVATNGSARNGATIGPLRDKLELRDVTYTYPGGETPALRNINLEVPAQSTVGLVGKTGSGKTTTVDILLGLLRPTEGKVLVDGVPIVAQNVRAWQQTIGYVPQDIYLTDNSIWDNIAFGIPKEQIDQDAVERAARAAQIHEFIATELPGGYETVAGERGVRLSGGQRQRIGIARALYHDPSVLVFDEATSALDHDTEQAVMEAIEFLTGEKTIIMIAHRISTMRSCDMVYSLDRGLIYQCSTYDELTNGAEVEQTT